MSTILRIRHVDGIGVFHDFHWPRELHDFSKYNLVYGLNGSGKTTFSNILRTVELGKCTEGKFAIITDEGDISSSNLENGTQHTVRVFNRDFISESVFTPSETCPPIFVIGRDSAEKKRQLEEFKANLKQLAVELQGEEQASKNASDKRDELTKTGASRIKEMLRSPGTDNPYNNYDKRNYENSRAAYKRDNRKPKELTPENSTSCKETANGKPEKKIPGPLSLAVELDAITEKTTELLERSIVSEVIAALKDRPAINTWVAQGFKIHTESGETTCNYCNGKISTDRIVELSKHFSEEYSIISHDICALKDAINLTLKKIDSLQLPKNADFYGDLLPNYTVESSKTQQDIRNARTYLEECAKLLELKLANPFSKPRLDLAKPASPSLISVNDLIEKHNARSDNFNKSVIDARKSLEESIVAIDYDQIETLDCEIAAAAKKTVELKTKIDGLNLSIAKLDSEIREHRRPADQINADLADYLGRKDIQLSVEDEGYRIMRNGVTARKLSEGEKTALALIYFLNSLESRDFDKAKGVVVIDDPVSSLDSNALFYAHSYIFNRTKGVGQLFILTHNFNLLRLVRKSFGHLNQTEAYMIKASPDATQRQAELKPLDPLLYKQESEYAYLFSEIIKGTSAHGDSVEFFYHYPNMARRFLEAFISFRLPSSLRIKSNDKMEGMNDSLKRLEFDPVKTMRILNFLNAQSHNRHHDSSLDHNDSILLETPAILRELLELIKHSDCGHYDEMIRLISTQLDDPTPSERANLNQGNRSN